MQLCNGNCTRNSKVVAIVVNYLNSGCNGSGNWILKNGQVIADYQQAVIATTLAGSIA